MRRVSAGSKLTEGEMRVFDIDRTKVGVAAAGGRLYAFDDACTHMGCSLGEGKLEGTTVTCPCHGSQFDVTSGAVIRGPAHQPVRSRSVQIEGDYLLVEW
jgi:nitrite reductase/ring-hydroxylating ferredoxin subunit